MGKVYRILENEVGFYRSGKLIKEGDDLRGIIDEAEKLWQNKRDAGENKGIRMDVLEVEEDESGGLISEKVVWLSEWYDGIVEFGGEIASGYKEDVAIIEKPRYCEIGPYKFYQAYGLDYCGNRYLIEWPVDQLHVIAGYDRPYNHALPENVYRLDSYKSFPKKTSMYD